MASTDDIETNKKFAKQNKASFPILSDSDKSIAKKYGVLVAGLFASRTTFIIDKIGRVFEINKKVNPSTAGTQIEDAINRLLLLEQRDTDNGT